MYDLPGLLSDPDAVTALRGAMAGGVPAGLRDAKIRLTARCNLRCTFCPVWKTPPVDELDTAMLCGVLDDLAALHCRKVHFTGGEPLLRADLAALVRHAAGLGLRVALTSNTTLLDDAVAAALIAAGLHSLNVSLDGVDPAAHDRLRGVKGAHKRALRGLRAVLRARRHAKAKTRIRLNMVLTRHNYQAYPEVLALAGELGVTDVTPLPVDEGKSARNRLLPAQLREYNTVVAPAVAALRARFGFADAPHLIYPFGEAGDDLRRAAEARYAQDFYANHLCYAPWLTTLIAADGQVWPCCMTRGKMPALGSVRETSFREIYHGEAYQAFRVHLRQTRLPLCFRCDNYLAENRCLANTLHCSSPD